MKLHLLARSLIVTITLFLSQFAYSSTPALQTLIDDLKLYKFVGDGTRFIHSGDLYEHSMWVYNAALELIDEENLYNNNLHLTPTERYVFSIAALLHDIGKAGRKDLFDKTYPTLSYTVFRDGQNKVSKIEFKPDRQEHPRVGFEYLAQPFLNKSSLFKQQSYRLSSGAEYDFNNLFKELDINNENRQLIAILVGIHYEFGNLCSNRISHQGFMDKIQELVNAVSYNHNIITRKLLLLSILIQVADVKGLSPVAYCPSTQLFPQQQKLLCTHPLECEVPDAFKEFGYVPTREKPIPFKLKKMQEMIAYFDQQTNHATSPSNANITALPAVA